MNTLSQVLAIGSPHGDDQVAWRLVERLGMRPSINAHVVALSDPWRLHDHLEGCDRLIVVDACAGLDNPGTISRLEWPDARIQQQHSHSTHGIGVADALQLAEKLELLPSKVILFGVELADCQPVGSLSEAAEVALSELEEMILLEIQ